MQKLYVALLVPFVLSAQGPVVLNPSPSRIIGHPQLRAVTDRPNLVEGRELNQPQSVAVDTSSDPPILYVADTGNNRVLSWRNAQSFENGQTADLVIGQRDRFSTLSLGPNTTLTTGLTTPTSVAVDSGGNLYVVDAGNNRILRYPRPYSQVDALKLPDLVIGQPNYNSRLSNAGGLSARSLATLASAGPFRTGLAFDSEGNLWFADAGNSRVLRYPLSALAPNPPEPPAADLVLGQPDFITNSVPTPTAQNVLLKNRMRAPSSLTFDAGGRLFVVDGLNRALVFTPPFATGGSAARIMGITVVVQGQPAPLPINERSMGIVSQGTLVPPEGVFTIGDVPFIVDTPASRILRYDPFPQWAPETQMQISPPARAVIAQDAMAQSRPLVNRGKPEPANNALFFPVQAVFAAGEIYVADSFNNRVIVFPDLSTGPAVTSTGPYLARRVLGQVGFDLQAINLLEGRELWEPNGIAIDALSDPPRLYVADTLNNRILGFRDARKLRPGDKADIVIGQPDFLRSIGNYPSGDTDQPTDSNLLIPQDVTVDSEGNLWVADTGNGRVLRFPKPFEQSQQRANLVIGQSGFTTKITDASARTMGRPSGLAFTGEGHLVVADRGHHRVLFFLKPLSTGMAATKVLGQADYGSSVVGNAVNRLNTPRHIAIDSDDRLYVADSGNNRIMVWDRVTIAAETNSLSAVQIENGLASNQRLRTPVGVAVNQRTGEIWVTDFSVTPNRLLRYPSYFNLVANPNVTADAAIPIIGPLSAAFDGFGNLFVSDLLHRVGMYFHGSRTLNSAHYGRGRVGDFSGQALAPGMVASIFSLGTDLASEVKVFNELPEPIPLPTELADTQVLVNDRPAPLYFVSRRQVNFQVPSNIPDSGDLEIQVVRPSLGQVLAAGCTTVQTAGAATADPNDDRYQCTGPVQATVASPALFTADATGTGHLAALNQDSTVNSVSNPASRGQVIQLFGTGQGRVPNAPPDGTPATGLLHTEETPTVIIGSSAVDPGDVQYSGLAPNLVGVWQINVRIPDRVAPANQVDVVVVYRSRVSNLQNPTGIRTTIAVR